MKLFKKIKKIGRRLRSLVPVNIKKDLGDGLNVPLLTSEESEDEDSVLRTDNEMHGAPEPLVVNQVVPIPHFPSVDHAGAGASAAHREEHQEESKEPSKTEAEPGSVQLPVEEQEEDPEKVSLANGQVEPMHCEPSYEGAESGESVDSPVEDQEAGPNEVSLDENQVEPLHSQQPCKVVEREGSVCPSGDEQDGPEVPLAECQVEHLRSQQSSKGAEQEDSVSSADKEVESPVEAVSVQASDRNEPGDTIAPAGDKEEEEKAQSAGSFVETQDGAALDEVLDKNEPGDSIAPAEEGDGKAPSAESLVETKVGPVSTEILDENEPRESFAPAKEEEGEALSAGSLVEAKVECAPKEASDEDEPVDSTGAAKEEREGMAPSAAPLVEKVGSVSKEASDRKEPVVSTATVKEEEKKAPSAESLAKDVVQEPKLLCVCEKEPTTNRFHFVNLEYKKLIDNGAFGPVVLMKVRHPKTLVVDKIINLSEKYSSMHMINREIQVMEIVKDHPLFLSFLCGCHNSKENSYHLIMEYFNGRPLEFLQKKELTHKNMKKMFYQICKGLQFLHEKGIIHRDIKRGNILANKKYDIKIIDFNLSTFGPYAKSPVGTSGYTAPEVAIFLDEPGEAPPYTYSCDYYSAGAVMFRLYYGRYIGAPADGVPRTQEQVRSLLKQASISGVYDYPHELPEPIMSFMKGLLQHNPELRLNDSNVLDHPYFASVADRKQKTNASDPSKPSKSKRFSLTSMLNFFRWKRT